MTSILNKKILVSKELASSDVGAFFQELGFELHEKFKEGEEYLFIVDGACPELPTYPRLQISDDLSAKFIPYVRSRISKDILASELGRKLLTSYFSDALEFDLVDRYSKELKDIYTVKIHDYLNIGFFVDSIIVEAYKAQFDIAGMRAYLNQALEFAFKKVEKSQEPMPLDVSYSHNGEAFAIQISLYADSFRGKTEFGDKFGELTANTNYFDSTYFRKKKKLTLSSLFYRNADLKKAKAYFITEIANRSAEIEESEANLHTGLVLKDQVNYQATAPVPLDQATKLALARKFALFIRNFRKNEEAPMPLSKLEVNDVINYLGHYPRQQALQDVDDEIKKFIFKLLKDDNLFNGLDEFVQKVASTNLDSQMSEIQKILGGKSLSDIEDILLIRGRQDEDSGSTRVKGWAESASDTQNVSGGNDSGMSDNELWEIRKLQLNVKLQDEVVRVNSEGRNIVQDDIVRVVAKELEVEEQDAKVVMEGIVEEVVSTEALNTKKLEEEFAKKILNTQSNADLVKEKLESQISRMKKVMEQMKHELLRLQAEKSPKEESKPLLAGDNLEATKLKIALSRTMDALKAKERINEKVKMDADSALKHKDLKIDFLEQRIEEVKAEFARSREFANEEKLEKLEADNKTLTLRLELANKKVNIISENIGNRDAEAQEKRDKEVDAAKGNVQLAQSIIEGLKQDKLKLEIRAAEDRDTIRKFKEERGAIRSDDEKDGIIQVLSGDRKALEDKLKLQGIELKKTEQKLKYTLSQLESSNKKKAAASGAKSADAYAKQLDQASARMTEATAEVSEKRREIVKLKQENSMMTNKITELEKKLAILDKKVA